MRARLLLPISLGVLSACGVNTDAPSPSPRTSDHAKTVLLAQKTVATVASDYEIPVQELYISYFGRPADPGGLANFEAALKAANSPTDIQGLNTAFGTSSEVQTLVNSFQASAESIALYGNRSTTGFVTAIYQNVLGRAPDAAGLNFWVTALDTKQLTRGNAALAIMAGALVNSSGQGVADALLITNRRVVATKFSDQLILRNAVNAYSGDAAAAVARDMLNAVSAVTNAAAYDVSSTIATLVLAAAPSLAGGVLSAAAYSVNQAGASVVISVNRTSGSSGALEVNYQTSDSTAKTGLDYAGQSGSLRWTEGDMTAKRIAISINNATPFAGTKTFAVMIFDSTNNQSPGAAIVTINGSGLAAKKLSVRVSGNRLIDAEGAVLQLRGVNISGLEGSIAGYTPDNPWGGQTGTPTPDWNVIKRWGVNAIRVPLNESSWLGLSCVDTGGAGVTIINGSAVKNSPGATIQADRGGNMKATVARAVADMTAAGLYVILELHWTAPGNACAMAQNLAPDAEHSVDFWSSVAAIYKDYPNVIFELFNEPVLNDGVLHISSPGAALRDGNATIDAYFTGGTPATANYAWKNAGMQSLLNAVRATGATNVVLAGPLGYAQLLDGWLEWKPTDPAGQLGATWHAYPPQKFSSEVGCGVRPDCSATMMNAAKSILAAGFPVIITEFGDYIGGSSAPMVSTLLPFADANSLSYFGWTWDLWLDQSASVLIKDAAGTPSTGFGTYVKQHYLCKSASESNCL